MPVKLLPVLKKLLLSLLTAVVVSFLAFTILYLSPGNPAEMLLMERSGGGNLNWDVVRDYADTLGMNDGFLVMYKNWFVNMLHGDLGTSYKTGHSVWTEFTARIGCSAKLALMATALALVLGITLGLLSARYRNRLPDKIVRLFSSVSVSVPSFWLAIAMLWLFGMKLKWFPIAKYDGFRSLVLPAVVLGLGGSAALTRITRGCVLENRSALYIMTARAKGLKEGAIFLRHMLKNILLPIITIASTNLISLLSGSVIIENIFSLPGIGNFLLGAIKLKDFPAILGFVFLLALMVVVVNLITELLYLALDPRVRQGSYESR